MHTNIENETEFLTAIDAYGDELAEITRRQAKAKALKQLLEAYANAMKAWKRTTDAYRFEMKRGQPALRCQKDVSASDVVALLRRAELKEYVTCGYDAELLKQDYAGTADGRHRLGELGLTLTDPQRHAVVKALRNDKE